MLFPSFVQIVLVIPSGPGGPSAISVFFSTERANLITFVRNIQQTIRDM